MQDSSKDLRDRSNKNREQLRDIGNFTSSIGKRRSSSVHKLSTIRTATDNTMNNIDNDKEESKFKEEETSNRGLRREVLSLP